MDVATQLIVATVVVLLAVIGLLLYRMEAVDRRAERTREQGHDALRRSNDLAFSCLRDGADRKLVELVKTSNDAFMQLATLGAEAGFATGEEFRKLRRLALETELNAQTVADARAKFIGTNPPQPRPVPEVNGQVTAGHFSDVAADRRASTL